MAVATGITLAAAAYTAVQQLYLRRHARLRDAQQVDWICNSPYARTLRLDRNVAAVHLSQAGEAAAAADDAAKEGPLATPASLSILRLTGNN